MISEKKLDKIREKAKKFMPETIEVRRMTRRPDGRGGWIVTETTVGRTIGRVQSLSPEEETIWGSKITNPQAFFINIPYYLPAGVTIRDTDELVINPDTTDIRVDIDDIIVGQSWQVETRLLCSKVAAERDR